MARILTAALFVSQTTSLDAQSWGRRRSASPAALPNKTMTVYHLFERKYTGLANKDGADFLGDAAFIFYTFNPHEVTNPEASMQNNIIEMSTVTVTDWSTKYLKCNAPGNNSSHAQADDCPKTSPTYCCIENKTVITSDSLPAYYESRSRTAGGYWLSFPAASEGKHWTEKVERRINGSCLGNAWRQDAGGCAQCGSDLDQCVASCIQKAMVTGSVEKNYSKLRPTWDRAFNDKTLCPDEPFPPSPSQSILIV